MLRRLLLPPALLLLTGVSMALVHWLLPGAEIVPVRVRWLGAPLALLGVLLSAAARLRFSQSGTTVYTFDAPIKLVADGVFRVSRNPMYLGLTLVLLGLSISLGSASPLLFVAGFVVITDRWYIAYEEQILLHEFGDAYAAYRQQTRRWL